MPSVGSEIGDRTGANCTYLVSYARIMDTIRRLTRPGQVSNYSRSHANHAPSWAQFSGQSSMLYSMQSNASIDRGDSVYIPRVI
jgi:hypothetical protein